MSRLLTDVADLAGYDERVTAPKYSDTLHIAREYAKYPSSSRIYIAGLQL